MKQSVVRANKRRYLEVKAKFHTSFNGHSNKKLGPPINESREWVNLRFFSTAGEKLMSRIGTFLMSRSKARVDVEVQSSRWCIKTFQFDFYNLTSNHVGIQIGCGVEGNKNDASAVCIRCHSLYFGLEELQKLGWPEPHLFLTRISSTGKHGSLRQNWFFHKFWGRNWCSLFWVVVQLLGSPGYWDFWWVLQLFASISYSCKGNRLESD